MGDFFVVVGVGVVFEFVGGFVLDLDGFFVLGVYDG